MRKQRIWQCICVTLTCAMTAFIFFNSAQTAEVSDGVSHGVLAWIEALFERHGVQTGLTNHIIRKSGHFLEYFILGALLLATLRSFSAKIRQNIFLPLFFGLLVPVLDETLQLVVEGRSGQVSDVLLDFSGALTGILLACAAVYLTARRRKKRNAHE